MFCICHEVSVSLPTIFLNCPPTPRKGIFRALRSGRQYCYNMASEATGVCCTSMPPVAWLM
ncbi:unnamed protein product, partial [Nesidiocoris tenuis]